jgi:hypothetical protein
VTLKYSIAMCASSLGSSEVPPDARTWPAMVFESGLAAAVQEDEWSEPQRAPERAALVSSSLWEKRNPNSTTLPRSSARTTETSANSTRAWARSEPRRFAKTNATRRF